MDFAAQSAWEADQGQLLGVVIVMLTEEDRGNGGQGWVQLLRFHAVLLQQGASIGAVSALLNGLPVLDLVLQATGLRLEGLVGEATRHDAVDEINRLGLFRFAGLEGVCFDVLDRTGMDLVSEALVRSMVASEFRL